jgi:hypothetical protein
MIVVAVVGILSVSLADAVVTARKWESHHRHFTLAAAVLAREMERVKITRTAGLSSGPHQSLDQDASKELAKIPGGTGSLSVAAMAGEPGVVRVDVTVRWTDPWGRERNLRSVALKAGG